MKPLLSNYKPEAYTRKDLFNYVESELLDIEQIMNETNEYGRATRGAVQALLARLYLNAEIYTGTARYTDCITYAKRSSGPTATRLRAIGPNCSMPITTCVQTRSSSRSS